MTEFLATVQKLGPIAVPKEAIAINKVKECVAEIVLKSQIIQVHQ
jgi:hypothetical protein